MSAGKRRCPVRWAGRQAVVTLPERISAANADSIRAQLLAVIALGANELIADLTPTLSCDHEGAGALIQAYEHSIVSGAQLRLTVPHPEVYRGLSVGGLVQLIPTYSSLPEAIAGGTAGPRIWAPGGNSERPLSRAAGFPPGGSRSSWLANLPGGAG